MSGPWTSVWIIAAGMGLVVLSSAAAWGAERPADFGRQWIRTHPYTLMGLIQFDNLNTELYQQCGLNTALAWKKAEGMMQAIAAAKMPWLGHITGNQGPNPEFQEQIADWMKPYPGCVGWIFNDEPNLARMGYTAQLIAWARQRHPDLLVLSNALPAGDRPWNYAGPDPRDDYDYLQYVNDYIQIVRPDVMMFDIYPFQDQGGPSNLYFLNLQVVRDAALKAGIPYWLFVQSYIDRNRRLLSEGDNRLQLFCPLTFGYTGMAYFTYDGSWTDGLLRGGREKMPLFDYAAKANREVLNIAGPIRFLTSTQVRFIKATHGSAVPQGLRAWDRYTDREPLFKEITIDMPAEIPTPQEDRATYLADAPYMGGLIGYFRDDSGQKYFMITNTWHSLTAPADGRELTFRILFDPQVTTVQRLNRMTGKVEGLPVDPETGLIVTLPGGTGDLFKFGPGPFVGLDDGPP